MELESADGPVASDEVNSQEFRAYQRDIGKVPLLNAEEEVVFAKAIELGEQIVEEPWRAVLSLWLWTRHDTEHDSRQKRPEHRLARRKRMGFDLQLVTGAPGRTRTADAHLRTVPLYPLSYGGAVGIVASP
jgi:hypothetical protein